MAITYDAIVVGARCAGSATAMLLARRGRRVLVVDKATFPSDTLSTHYIHQPGVAALHRWGLLPEVVASGCPPIRTQLTQLGPVRLEAAPPPVDGIADAYCVRRTVLDDILVRAAEATGAVRRRVGARGRCRPSQGTAGRRRQGRSAGRGRPDGLLAARGGRVLRRSTGG